jgi:HEAT repeat protein
MTEEQIQQLIARAGGSSDDGQRAAAELVLLGAQAVVPIVEALRTAGPGARRILNETLSRIRVPEALPLLEPITRETSSRTAPAAIAAVGYSHHPDAFRVLSDLAHKPSAYHKRTLEAMGELGDPRGVALLQAEAARLVSEPQDPAAAARLTARAAALGDASIVSDFIAIAATLAKLGDHSLAGSVSALAGPGREASSDPESAIIRLEATYALRYLVGPGVFRALCDALHDSDGELQVAAMRAMRLLGAKEVVPPWIDLVQTGGRSAALAYSMIHQLVGEWPNGVELIEHSDKAEIPAWWAEREARLLSGTVYRFGRRAWPPDLFPWLGRGDLVILDEFRTITGVELSLIVDPQLVLDGRPDPMLVTATAWWEREGAHFEHGALYKYGRRQDLSRAFD